MKKDAYKRIAPWYDILIEPLNRALGPLGFKLFGVAADMRVLEVGCGTGSQMAFYRDRGCRITGIDLSAAMLAEARTRLDGRALVCRGDGARLPWPDNTFDRVLATLVLHEMAPALRPAVLTEMKRVLGQEGRLGIVDYHPVPLRSLKGLLARGFIGGIERAAGRDHHCHFQDFLESGGVPALARRQGLRVEATKRVSGGNIGLYRLRRKG